MSRLRVGVMFGGRSPEHEVSLVSARNVIDALDPARFEVVPIAIDRSGDLEPLLSLQRPGSAARLDVVFPVIHGSFGEDGTIQGLLELLDVPFVGPGVLGSAVGMDKDVAKRLLSEAGIPVVPCVVVRRREYERDPAGLSRRIAPLGWPVFTKPANAGSSVGVRRVTGPEELDAAVQHALEFDDKALIEAAVEGVREIECAVLGNDEPRASLPGEVIVQHRDGFYTYEAKYLDESGARLEIPARLSEAETRRVQELALETVIALECQGMSRVDFFLRADGELFVNEVNTIPGFTAQSMYPKMWEKSGLPPRELMAELVRLAVERHDRRRALRRERSA